MPRIYSNYDPKEYEEVKAKAESMGFSASSFQKYCVMLYLRKDTSARNNSLSLVQLSADMMNALNGLPHNSKPFIVSSLFRPEVWSELSSSIKHTLANQLAKFVRENPADYTVHSRVKGEPVKYRKV